MNVVSQRPAMLDATIAPESFRTSRSGVDSDSVIVSRMGGNFSGGILHGVSLISRGEALGHGMWIDDVTVAQVAEFAAADSRGVRSRFTHPGMSSDGLGRHLGRIFDAGQQGDRVIGDLHFARLAHRTPEGNLAEYVMNLAQEDPHAAGLSIVFERDMEQEIDFLLAHGATDEGGYISLENFRSPDAGNGENLPHVRIAELRAADVVDEPAANPEGLFDRQGEVRKIDQLLTYAAGLAEKPPTESAFNVNPDRAAQFLTRWLESHSLQLTPIEAEDMPEVTETPAPSREDFKAELKKFTDAFGAENGQKWFDEDWSFAEATQLQNELLIERIAELTDENERLNKRIDDIELGEPEPIETGAADGESKKKTFAEFTASRN